MIRRPHHRSTRSVRWWAAPALVLIATGAVPAGEGPAGGGVEGPPRPFLTATGEVDGVIEASAVEPIGDGRLLLVAHDKDAALVVVEAAGGRRVGEPLTCGAFPAGLKAGPKWEGMARDEEGNYYVVGSHSGTEAEQAERSFLLRFRLVDGEPVAIDEASVVRWDVAGALADALRDAGLDEAAVGRRKVEGLAVRTVPGGGGREGRRELVIGLREPDDRVRALVADITEAPGPDARLALRPLFDFDAGQVDGVRLQLTSLEHLDAWGGFLVLTATEDGANAFHGNALWFVPGDAATEPVRLWSFEPGMKAEGICVLPGEGEGDGGPSGAIRLAVVYDNDPKGTRIPSRLQVITLGRRPR